MRYFIIIALILLILLIIRLIIDNKTALRIRHERIGEGIRIAHISDLHRREFGKGNARICEAVKAEKPDIIFITGDLVSRTSEDFAPAEALLRGLCSIAPVYMIFGNHEQSLPRKKASEFIEMVMGTDAILLRNETVRDNINGRETVIAGLEPSYTTYVKNKSYRDLDEITLSDVNELIGECPEGYVILLAHNPLFGEVYAKWGADITLSGHVHGGAVRIFGRGILSPERKFFPKYSKGVYEVGGKKLLVSAGLGKFRLFDPPEIVIYDV